MAYGDFATLDTDATDNLGSATEHPARHNEVAAAVNSVYAELGTNPSLGPASGENTTVAARLDKLETAMPAVVTETTTSRTVATADAGKAIDCTNGSAVTITVPTNANDPIPVGTVIEIAQIGAGQVTVSGAGVTFQYRSPTSAATIKTAGQYAVIGLRKRATDTWLVSGDLL